MNITSLLQEVPSIDRMRRKLWEDTVSSAKTVGDVHTPGEPLGREIEQMPSQEPFWRIQTAYGYRHLSPSTESYLKPSERENDKVGLPPLVQTDYIDPEAAEGAARMRKGHLSNPQREQHMAGTGQRPSMDETRLFDANTPPTFKRQLDDPRPSNDIVPVPLLPPPRTPSPTLDPVHLGTYVYPNLPFPIRRSLLPFNRRTTLNIFVPRSHFPLGALGADPRARSLWGGIPYVDERKLYTDDSDVLFAALHAGVVDLRELQNGSGRDLDLTLRVFPASDYGRYLGGPGAAGLTSASWGNSHEGAAFMITSHSWLQGNVKKTYTRQTRKARMAEENRRRSAIMNSSEQTFILRPSAKLSPPPSLGDAPISIERSALEEELQAVSVSGLWQNASGIKYDPMTFYLLLFHQAGSIEEQTPLKPNKHSPYTKRTRPIRYNPDIVLEHSNRPLERFVLVATSADRVAQPSPLSYSLYREDASAKADLQEVNSLKSSLKGAPTPNATPIKSIRFAEAPQNKGECPRHLVYENLGVQDFAFASEGLSINGVLYPVERWRWSENKLEPRAPLVPPKPRSLKKKARRSGKKMVTPEMAQPTTAQVVESIEPAPSAPDGTMQIDVPEQVDDASKNASVAHKDSRDAGVLTESSSASHNGTQPADRIGDGEEREEGELSG